MAKNLFDYADLEENEKQFKSCENYIENQSEKQRSGNVNEEFLRSKVDEYSKMSQSEMLSKLLTEVETAKMNGVYDHNKITSSIETIREFLTPQQQQSLELLLKRIK